MNHFVQNGVKVAPSILSADFSEMGATVERLEKQGADWIHCDVMDGTFVPNITFGHHMVRDVRKHTDLPLDVHLMIVQPERHIENFAQAGADFITVHHEACGNNLKNVLRQIRAFGVKCGAVINPDTPLSAVYNVLEEIDLLLVMSVFPGFGGQKFIASVLEKTREARAVYDRANLRTDIEIDGGVNEENCAEIVRAGVNILVAGNTVFKSADPAATIARLKNGGR